MRRPYAAAAQPVFRRGAARCGDAHGKGAAGAPQAPAAGPPLATDWWSAAVGRVEGSMDAPSVVHGQDRAEAG